MKIAITRLENKAAGDHALCASYGHDCSTVSPLRSEIRMEKVTRFVDAVHRDEFDCLFFTSALPAMIVAPRLTRWPRVIAIGPKTAEILGESGIEAEVLPAYYSRDFVPYLGDWLRGRTVGIPRADVPNPGLLDGITAAGAGTTRRGYTPSSPRVRSSPSMVPMPFSSRAPCPTGRHGGSPATTSSS